MTPSKSMMLLGSLPRRVKASTQSKNSLLCFWWYSIICHVDKSLGKLCVPPAKFFKCHFLKPGGQHIVSQCSARITMHFLRLAQGIPHQRSSAFISKLEWCPKHQLALAKPLQPWSSHHCLRHLTQRPKLEFQQMFP